MKMYICEIDSNCSGRSSNGELTWFNCPDSSAARRWPQPAHPKKESSPGNQLRIDLYCKYVKSRRGIDVLLLWVLCVVKQRYLHLADHSSRGVKWSWSRMPEKEGHGPKSRRRATGKKICKMPLENRDSCYSSFQSDAFIHLLKAIVYRTPLDG